MDIILRDEDINEDGMLIFGLIGIIVFVNGVVVIDENGYVELEYCYFCSYVIWYDVVILVFG